MGEMIWLAGVLFVGAVFIAWAMTRVGRRRPVDIAPNEALRLKTANKVYRCRFEGYRGRHLVLAAPIARDSWVPIEVGSLVAIELTRPTGVVAFASKVVAREAKDRLILIESPRDVYAIDRRQAKRRSFHGRVSIFVEDTEARLIDLSESGLKLRTFREFTKGERVKIELPWWPAPHFAWVIEAKKPEPGSHTYEYRAIFEDRVPMEELPESA